MFVEMKKKKVSNVLHYNDIRGEINRITFENSMTETNYY
jgi:hypothetical protein